MTNLIFASEAGAVVAALFPGSGLGRDLMIEARERAEDQLFLATIAPYLAAAKAVTAGYAERIEALGDAALLAYEEVAGPFEDYEQRNAAADTAYHAVFRAADVDLIHVIALGENIREIGHKAARIAIEEAR